MSIRSTVVTAVAGAVVAALALAALPAPAQGFECAPLQPSAARSPAYRAVSGQARCEGYFEQKVSQPFIELVSLTRGPLPVAAGSPGAVLELRTDLPTATRLVVQPQRSGPFYRVDALLPGGQPLRWDGAPMLASTGLRLADLGFLALAGASTPTATAVMALAPVALTAQASTPTRVTAVVRVSVEVSSVSWRSYRLGAEAWPATAWATLPDSQLFAWQRLALPIEWPSDGKGLHIDVQAVGADDGRALPLLRFVMLGRGDVASK